MACDKCGTKMPLITTIEVAQAEPLQVYECASCARGIIVEGHCHR